VLFTTTAASITATTASLAAVPALVTHHATAVNHFHLRITLCRFERALFKRAAMKIFTSLRRALAGSPPKRPFW
jgi:hypothetical protein